MMVVVTKVRTHDGAPAYLLPGGTIVLVEAWEDIAPATRQWVIERDAARLPSPEV